jgi:hypothetical protein
LLAMGRGNDARAVQVKSVPPLTAALKVFSGRVRRGVGGQADLALGSQVVRVISAAERAISEGVAVSIDQAAYSATSGAVG